MDATYVSACTVPLAKVAEIGAIELKIALDPPWNTKTFPVTGIVS